MIAGEVVGHNFDMCAKLPAVIRHHMANPVYRGLIVGGGFHFHQFFQHSDHFRFFGFKINHLFSLSIFFLYVFL